MAVPTAHARPPRYAANAHRKSSQIGLPRQARVCGLPRPRQTRFSQEARCQGMHLRQADSSRHQPDEVPTLAPKSDRHIRQFKEHALMKQHLGCHALVKGATPKLSRDPNFVVDEAIWFHHFFKSHLVKIGHFSASNRNESCRFLPTVHPYIFNISPLFPPPLEKNHFFTSFGPYEKTTPPCS